jgi:hypothetical protein
MGGATTVASLRPESTVGRLAERVVIVAIAAGFLLALYTTMGRRAEDTVAQGNLAAIRPLAHAYAVDHGSYVGMTLEALEQGYGLQLEPGTSLVIVAKPIGFCLQTTQEGRTWRIGSSEETPALGTCDDRTVPAQAS